MTVTPSTVPEYWESHKEKGRAWWSIVEILDKNRRDRLETFR